MFIQTYRLQCCSIMSISIYNQIEIALLYIKITTDYVPARTTKVW